MEFTFQIFLVRVAYTETGLTIKWEDKLLNVRPEGQPADVVRTRAVYATCMPDLSSCSGMHARRDQSFKNRDNVRINSMYHFILMGKSQLWCQFHTSKKSWPK
jgi:hypothetical protein